MDACVFFHKYRMFILLPLLVKFNTSVGMDFGFGGKATKFQKYAQCHGDKKCFPTPREGRCRVTLLLLGNRCGVPRNVIPCPLLPQIHRGEVENLALGGEEKKKKEKRGIA